MPTTPADIVESVDLEVLQGADFYVPMGLCGTAIGMPSSAMTRNTAYAVGDRRTPDTPNGYAYSCSTAGTTHASTVPTFPTAIGKTVSDGTAVWTCVGQTVAWDFLFDTTGYSATMEIREEDFDGDTQLELSTGSSTIEVGFDPPKWANATIYALGQQVVPTALNGYIYECVVAGTSAGAEPNWPVIQGNTVLDNTVRWRCEMEENTTDKCLVSNLRIFAPASTTAALTDWGRGRYTLQVFDTFGHLMYWMDGKIYLRRETTY